MELDPARMPRFMGDFFTQARYGRIIGAMTFGIVPEEGDAWSGDPHEYKG
jgi:hypothetical protein